MRSSLCLCVVAFASTKGAFAQLVVSETYKNLEPRDLVNVPVTMSRVGGDGDFAAGITPKVGGVELPAQVDVLRTAPDGSPRHALVSFEIPFVPASGTVNVKWLNKTPPAPVAFDWAGHDVSPPALALTLASVDYGNLVSDLGAVLAAEGWYGPSLTVKHDGPVMKEFAWTHVPAGQPADQYVTVFWRVRVYSGEASMRVEAVVENCNPRVSFSPTPLHYQFSGVTMWHGAAMLYQEGGYDHVDQTRYRIVEWTAGALEDLQRNPNFEYLVENKFLPAYQLTNDAPPQYRNMTAAAADAIYLAQSNGRNDDVRDQGILEQGIIFDQMPATGGRWDIGLYPGWVVTYLLTHAPGLYERILHADGNGAGSYYVHVRSDEGYPGYNVLTLPTGRRPLDNVHRINIYQFNHRPDHAHAPSLGYMAYLMTGDEYYGEEMSFWASYQLGEYPYNGLNTYSAERDQAWSFRHVVDAAFVLPDDHPLVPYFVDRMDAYAAELDTRFVQSGREIHFIADAVSSSGRMEWVNANFCSPWQASWLVSSMGNAVDKGFGQFAEFREWSAEYIVGLYTSYKDPAHDFVGPDGVTYKYDPIDAMPYSCATSLWQTEVYMHDNDTAGDPSDDFLATRKISRIKNISKYGEVWYYTKVNQDNEWAYDDIYAGPMLIKPAGLDPLLPLPEGLDLDALPDSTIGNWPIRDNGWGHGLYYWHLNNPPGPGPWWNWHRYGAWDGVVSALNGQVTDSADAWEELQPLAGQTDYGFEMVPQTHYVPSNPAPANIVRLEVAPHTEAASPGSFVDYTATAIYRNAFGHDVPIDATPYVTFQSGDPAVASFTGSRLNVTAEGLVVVRATLDGTSIANDRPVLLAATTDTKPIVLYAGWGDSYAVKGQASAIEVMARVADLDDDVMHVGLESDGVPLMTLRDDGTGGDAVAGDGVFSRVLNNLVFNVQGDTYYEIVALDETAQSSMWPYVTVGAPSPPPASGFRVMPFVSERHGDGPRLRGVGFGVTDLQPGVPGTLHLIAEGSADRVDKVLAFADAMPGRLTNGINDNGQGADQFAGDGLYMGAVDLTPVSGTHLVDFLPVRDGFVKVGDAYPRFRVHREYVPPPLEPGMVQIQAP